MKKLILIIFAVFLYVSKTAYAGFDTVLNDVLQEYGVYNGEKGIIFSSIDNFVYDEPFLFLCYTNGSKIKCSVYNNSDGVQCIDTLDIEFKNNTKLSSVIYDDTAYLMLECNDETEYFAILAEAFSHIPEIEYLKKTTIFEIKNNKLKPQMSYKEIYNFLNAMKTEKINSYPFMNKVNTIDSLLYDGIKRFLLSCSDLTSFDINNYDYDRIFKYVLFTHRNFMPFTQINPHTDESDTVKRVNAEFIDFIMYNILNISPEHPPSTDLVKRGFCYSDGMYLYKGGFNADYKTEILDIEATHDLGGGVYHIIFSDIYTENGIEIPEYSYAVVDTSKNPYTLLRIGMGQTFLRSDQVRDYAKSLNLTTPAWEISQKTENRENAFVTVFWSIIFVVAIVLGTIIVIMIKRKK